MAIPCVLALPYACRFFQCCRQYSDTKEKNCLLNGEKGSLVPGREKADSLSKLSLSPAQVFRLIFEFYRSRITWVGDNSDIPRRSGGYQETFAKFDADAESGLGLSDIEDFVPTSSLIYPLGPPPLGVYQLSFDTKSSISPRPRCISTMVPPYFDRTGCVLQQRPLLKTSRVLQTKEAKPEEVSSMNVLRGKIAQLVASFTLCRAPFCLQRMRLYCNAQGGKLLICLLDVFPTTRLTVRPLLSMSPLSPCPSGLVLLPWLPTASPACCAALKYATAFPVILFSGVKYRVPLESWRGFWKPLWILSAVINSSYSFYWDVARDWDLTAFSSAACSGRNPGLRANLYWPRKWVSMRAPYLHRDGVKRRLTPSCMVTLQPSDGPACAARVISSQHHLLSLAALPATRARSFPLPLCVAQSTCSKALCCVQIYYWAVVSDGVLRASWTYKLSAHLRHNHLTVFFFSAMEITRRFQVRPGTPPTEKAGANQWKVVECRHLP